MRKRSTDAPEIECVPRRAARVILRNPGGAVLLIRYAVDDRVFWTTPGGAAEPGETDHDAALRELQEELRLTTVLHGPVHRTVGRFHHEGRYVENTDTFFAGRLDEDAPSSPVLHGVTAFEQQAMQQARWWTAAEIDSATEEIFPRDLAEVLRRLEAADQ